MLGLRREHPNFAFPAADRYGLVLKEQALYFNLAGRANFLRSIRIV
jgi:hypothetical protein